jgi:hypothetical protein
MVLQRLKYARYLVPRHDLRDPPLSPGPHNTFKLTYVSPKHMPKEKNDGVESLVLSAG